jgi:hypothetical protein
MSLSHDENQGFVNRLSSDFESFLDAFSGEEENSSSNDSLTLSTGFSTIEVSTTNDNSSNSAISSYDYVYVKQQQQQDDEANIALPESLIKVIYYAFLLLTPSQPLSPLYIIRVYVEQ